MTEKIQVMRVLQINLHHSRVALAALCVAMKNCDVALIQEPWPYKGEINGLREVRGELIYSRSNQNPRNCILVKKGFQLLPMTQYCYRDLTTVKITASNSGGLRRIVLGSAYLPLNVLISEKPNETR
jgi:hypothetical protein